jgi:hypothetical protein
MFYIFAERSFLFQKDLLFSLKDLLYFFRKDLLQFRVMNEVCNNNKSFISFEAATNLSLVSEAPHAEAKMSANVALDLDACQTVIKLSRLS